TEPLTSDRESNSAMTPKVAVQGLYKIFGPNPKLALQQLAGGKSKDEILRQTGNTVALADVSFEVAPGEIFIVMGLSGSGKSTLIRCVNRLINPTRGRVFVDGQDVTAMSQQELREIR